MSDLFECTSCGGDVAENAKFCPECGEVLTGFTEEPKKKPGGLLGESFKLSKPNQIKKICTSCGYVGSSKKITKGSIALELLLWIAFLIPGVIYSIWRLTSRYEACPQCKNASMIPVNTPTGKKLAAEQ